MAARLPRPGGPVRGSATGRPLMAAMDLLGRRWALRILWELRDGPLGARALQSRCDRMSSSVLYQRLEELTDAGLLARDKAGAYRLTDLGAALAPALESLDSWARHWSDALSSQALSRVVSRKRRLGWPKRADLAGLPGGASWAGRGRRLAMRMRFICACAASSPDSCLKSSAPPAVPGSAAGTSLKCCPHPCPRAFRTSAKLARRLPPDRPGPQPPLLITRRGPRAAAP